MWGLRQSIQSIYWTDLARETRALAHPHDVIDGLSKNKTIQKSTENLFRVNVNLADLPSNDYNYNSFNYFRTVLHSALLVYKGPSIYKQTNLTNCDI